MQGMNVRMTKEPIDYAALVEAARDHASGAVVLFLGTVRELSEGKRVKSLEYDAYPSMAEKKIAELLAQASEKWPINHATVVHRHGRLELGDIAVAVVTASRHRREAFAAAEWVMSAIKQLAPIWKKENWADGSAEWVHPDSVTFRAD